MKLLKWLRHKLGLCRQMMCDYCDGEYREKVWSDVKRDTQESQERRAKLDLRHKNN